MLGAVTELRCCVRDEANTGRSGETAVVGGV